MFKRFTLVLIASIICVTTAFADKIGKIESFYHKRTDQYWEVAGSEYPDQDKPPACFAQSVGKDGSTFQISINPAGGDAYMWFQDNDWQVDTNAQNKILSLRVNTYRDDRIVLGGEWKFQFVSKNMATIKALDPKKLFKILLNLNKMVFIMPGNVSNITLAVPNSKAMVKAFGECIYAYEKAYNG